MTHSHGLLSELLLVRMHGKSAAYLEGDDATRAAVVARCRGEATVTDLAERILARTIYAQAATRVAPLRELLQNALDASPRGARIDVGSSEDGSELVVSDPGRGMARDEVLLELLVPFSSGKHGDADAIGEHGIGFFSVLEIAPRLEITTVTRAEAWRLVIAPVGPGPRFGDFTWALSSLPPPPRGAATGTTVRCSLARPIARATLASEIAAAAGLVDPAVARIHVNGAWINAARPRLRHVARAPIDAAGEAFGELDLYLGRGDGIEPQLTVIQGGLLVGSRQDAFSGAAHGLHRELLRAIASAGFGVIVELPLAVPLNKGRSAVAGHASRAVDLALTAAFERFVLEDALHDRELLRAVDHRLSTVLDRLVLGALQGEAGAPPEPDRSLLAPGRPEGRGPTVAAPEEVVRFAAALLDAPVFEVVGFDPLSRPLRQKVTLRHIVHFSRSGVLREPRERAEPGCVHLAAGDPLSDALWRRLSGFIEQAAAPRTGEPPRARDPRPVTLQRTTRQALLEAAAQLPGMQALCAAMTVLERIDGAISLAAGLAPSPISVHQDLYGPDEMAHTDGSGISCNLASARVRALLDAVLRSDDVISFSALVDLLLHEKTHVSLASYVPRSTAEHGASFYRKKDQLRRMLLEAIGTGAVADPIRWLAVARRGLASTALPAPAVLAAVFAASSSAAA